MRIKGGDIGGGKLIPQPHGGALLSGGTLGQRGGTGRPPSAIRALLRGSFEQRIRVLEEIADNGQASAADRIRAIDLLAKYSLGARSELTGADGGPVELATRQCWRIGGKEIWF